MELHHLNDAITAELAQREWVADSDEDFDRLNDLVLSIHDTLSDFVR